MKDFIAIIVGVLIGLFLSYLVSPFFFPETINPISEADYNEVQNSRLRLEEKLKLVEANDSIDDATIAYLRERINSMERPAIVLDYKTKMEAEQRTYSQGITFYVWDTVRNTIELTDTTKKVEPFVVTMYPMFSRLDSFITSVGDVAVVTSTTKGFPLHNITFDFIKNEQMTFIELPPIEQPKTLKQTRLILSGGFNTRGEYNLDLALSRPIMTSSIRYTAPLLPTSNEFPTLSANVGFNINLKNRSRK